MDTVAEPHTSATPAEPYGVLTAPDTLRIERLMPASVEQVWSYITDSEKRGKWFAGGPMELRERGSAVLTFRNSDLSGGLGAEGVPPADPVHHVMTGIITRCEPMRVLAFNWNADESGSETIFELTPEGDQTRLVLTHRRLSSRGQILNVSGGWHTHIGILLDLVSGVTPRLFWPAHKALGSVYQDRLGDLITLP